MGEARSHAAAWRWQVPVLGALLLAACGGGEADYNTVEVDEQAARAQATIDARTMQVGAKQAERSGMPVGEPAATAARGRALPTAFQGFWGVTADDCELANYAAMGRIKVDADRIRFYESRAQVERLTERSPNMVDVLLRFSGEGEDWTRATRLTLEEGGTHLVRTEQPGDGTAGSTTTYQRC